MTEFMGVRMEAKTSWGIKPRPAARSPTNYPLDNPSLTPYLMGIIYQHPLTYSKVFSVKQDYPTSPICYK